MWSDDAMLWAKLEGYDQVGETKLGYSGNEQLIGLQKLLNLWLQPAEHHRWGIPDSITHNVNNSFKRGSDVPLP